MPWATSAIDSFNLRGDVQINLPCREDARVRKHAGYLSTRSASESQPCRALSGPVSLKGVRNATHQLQSSLMCGLKSSLLSRTTIQSNIQPTVKAPRGNSKNELSVLPTSSMEETYDALARRLLKQMAGSEPCVKYLVGLAGPPGAGKSTVAKEVVSRLNTIWNSEVSPGKEMIEIAVAIPMDGFHLYRWQLDAMEDPVEAHARRGAPWTFDPVGLANRLTTLREKGSVSLPSFDHGVGDPVEDDIHVEDGHKAIVVEGNYLLLNEGGWKDLGKLFDERWFIDVDIDEAMRRVERRHVLTGKPPEVAHWRVAYNDRPNAELIQQSKWNADLLIPSTPLKTASAMDDEQQLLQEGVVSF